MINFKSKISPLQVIMMAAPVWLLPSNAIALENVLIAGSVGCPFHLPVGTSDRELHSYLKPRQNTRAGAEDEQFNR